MDRTQYSVKLSVEPSRGLVDEKFIVLVQKAPPGFQLTIHALHKCEDGNSWEAFGHYTTDATGTVNGMWFWKIDVQTPMVVTVSVYQGHQTEGFTDQAPLASVPVERWYMAPGVCKIPITEGGIIASLFLPSGPGPFPGILDLEGASMALNYLMPKIIMETMEFVKLEYFEIAYKVLEQHPQVLSSRIAMLGLSLGTSVTVRMAALSKVMKLRCAVGISRSHVQQVSDTKSLEELLECYIKDTHKIYTNEKKEAIVRNLVLPIPTDTSQKVDFRMDIKECCMKLSVEPSRGLADKKFIVQVHKAPPGFQLTIHASHKSEDGNSWEAFGHYTANATGTVNVSEDPSSGGTYSGVEQMGLMWSLRPIPGSKPYLRLRKMDVQTPMEVTISVYQGHQTDGFMELVPLASKMVERWFMGPGVRRIPITEGGLTATLFLPSGPGPFPGILDLWGGSGKLVEFRSALLASNGFASLVIDFITPKITLETGKMVDNQYFEMAYKVLEQHPQVISSRIAMLGLSLGASMTLKMAAYSKVMKLRCAVCISGSHVQPVEGSVEQLLGFFGKNSEKLRANEDNEVIYRDLLLPIPTDPAFKVDVGRLQRPLLLLLGDDDLNTPSYESAMDMKEMMERAGNSHLLSITVYPKTGHMIEPPYMPYARAGAYRTLTTRERVVALWGGETAAHSRAQEDAWRKTLVFLRENLFGCTTPGAPVFSQQ